MKKEVKPCPFCGKSVDLNNEDTLYPSGTGWKDHPGGIRSYYSFREVTKEQWCYDLHCVEHHGGCGVVMSGDSPEEAIEKWNKRV